MAIVEDEVRNESEEENEIEVVVEEDDGDRDSDDSEDEEYDDVLERKIAELEQRIADYPYNYDDHIELIQVLWELSELDRWRSAFDRLQEVSVIQPEHWLRRLQTEVTLAHSEEAHTRIGQLFRQAMLDCYSIPILSEWCTWSISSGDAAAARGQMEEVLKRAGADPLSGKLLWDAMLELERSQLEAMSEETLDHKDQKSRVLFCLEEILSRPLLRNEEGWQPFEEMALTLDDPKYIAKVKSQHEEALEYLQKITPYEDKLLTLENQEEKIKVYQEYIDLVKELSRDEKFMNCDSDGILKVLYDRATTECYSCPGVHSMLKDFAKHAHRNSSRSTYWRILDACVRRCPRKSTFWVMQLQQAEHEEKTFDQVKELFEKALSKGMESYKDAEDLWLSYLEYIRRRTNFDADDQRERLRQTFRLAWDSLGESWGDEANDCEVPLYWARLEYCRLGDPAKGKEIIEEIFKYGENKNLCKYWEALIHLECSRSPPPSAHKRRELYRRALRFVTDYPPSIARLWTDYERDYGDLTAARDCSDACETKLKEWKETYQAMKDKMIGNKKQKGKQADKKGKFDKKKKKREEEPPKNKNKRKSEETSGGSEAKRKRDSEMEVEECATEKKPEQSGSGVKRTLEEDEIEETENKRLKTESSSSRSVGTREACTLFVSNLEFKVDEQKLRDSLSKFGEIVSLRLKTGAKAFGGSIAYCQYKTPASVETALTHDRTPLDGRPMFFSRYSSKKTKQGFKYATTAEDNKLFVKNLPYSHCDKEQLTQIFDKYGKLKDVRVVTFKILAVMKGNAAPKELRYKQGFKYATTAEDNKLFVKNLPYSHCDKEQLTQIFDKYGKLKDVRVVTFKDGKPKGLAYIEYEDETSAAQALAATNGLLLDGRNIDVAVSRPPPKQETKPDPPTLGQHKSGQGNAMRRTQLSSFIPSVLQKPVASTSSNGHPPAKPLSNTDFRNLLLKK